MVAQSRTAEGLNKVSTALDQTVTIRMMNRSMNLSTDLYTINLLNQNRAMIVMVKILMHVPKWIGIQMIIKYI